METKQDKIDKLKAFLTASGTTLGWTAVYFDRAGDTPRADEVRRIREQLSKLHRDFVQATE